MTTINRQNLGIVLKKLRETKSISQEKLAKTLNIPRPSVTQIEKGARDLSINELDTILRVFQISYEDLMYLIKPEKKYQKYQQHQKYKIEFNTEKFKHLLLYIIQKCGSKPNVGETVLYKLLYFCDFDFFELNEKPLSGMPYKRLQYGPIPDQSTYNPIIQKMIEDGEIQRMINPYIKGTIQTKYLAFIEPNINIFTSKEIETINKVINRLSDMSARQIENHVHNDYPWKIHKDGEIIDYGSVFGREGEFAQRDYEAEFLQASVCDTFVNLPAITEEEYNYYMNLPDLPKN